MNTWEKNEGFQHKEKAEQNKTANKVIGGKKRSDDGEVGPDGIHQNYFLMFLIKQVQADRGLRGYFMPCSPT